MLRRGAAGLVVRRREEKHWVARVIRPARQPHAWRIGDGRLPSSENIPTTERESGTFTRAIREMAVLSARYASVSVRAFHDSASEIRTSIERTSDECRSDGAVFCPWWVSHCQLEAAMWRAARLLELPVTRRGLRTVVHPSWGSLT